MVQQRNLCLAVVLYIPDAKSWVLTGSIWAEVNVAEQCRDLAVWRADGYAAQLELVDLTHSHFLRSTHHVRELQRRWRRRFRARVQVWLRARARTGAARLSTR